MSRAVTALLLTLLAVQAAACSPADVLKAQLKASDDSIAGKTFHSLILAPLSDKRLAGLHPSQLDFEAPVHPADFVAAFLDHYRSLDGQDYNFDSIVHSTEARQMTRSRLLDFTVMAMTSRPLAFKRRGTTAVLLPHKSVESCIRAADFGLSYKLVEGAAKAYQIDFYAETVSLEAAEFSGKVLPFLQEACALIELAKNQVRPNEQSAAVFEFRSLKLLLDSPLAAKAKPILTALLAKYDSILRDFFGKRAVSTHLATFVAAEEILTHRARVLQGEGVKAGSADDFMYTIKYVFSISFIILVAVICISLYTLDIEKDSLIYAKFLVKKNN